MRRGAATEGLLTGLLGGIFGLVATSWFGLGWLGATVGALNGALGGWHGIYDWTKPRGWFGFVADSTWALASTAAALVFGALNLVRRDHVHVADLGRRRGYHVFAGGIGLRRDFALAIGNVIGNAGGSVGLLGESERIDRRRRFVVEHEGLHVFQTRLFGPVFPLIYAGWVILGGLVGGVVAVVTRADLWGVVETFAYYDNPFEYWAYRNNDYWPPKGAVVRFTWKPRR
jgi:hypothetical protein